MRFGGLVLSLMLLGCGESPSRGWTAGRVTFDDQPVTNAVICFDCEELGVALTAELDNNGQYVLESYQGPGLPPGVYRVAIKPHLHEAVDGQPFVGMPIKSIKPEVEIPVRYHDVATSGLSITVEAGSNPPFDFPLTK
jgi:hypothetical protein